MRLRWLLSASCYGHAFLDVGRLQKQRSGHRRALEGLKTSIAVCIGAQVPRAASHENWWCWQPSARTDGA